MSRDSRIYITGASCAGVTTLGWTLAQQLGVRHLDVDDFYWLPTDPPFTQKRPPDQRVRLIGEALGDGGWVLSGSFDGWGDGLIANTDLIVFVATPTPVRMQRLMDRERTRYGVRILPGGDMHEIHTQFVRWASGYDDPEFSGRSRARHDTWLGRQTKPILRVDGTHSLQDLLAAVVSKLPSGSPD